MTHELGNRQWAMGNGQEDAETKQILPVKAVNAWVHSAFGNVFSICIFCLIALQVMSSSNTFLIPIHIIQPHSYQNIHDQPYGMIFSF